MGIAERKGSIRNALEEITQQQPQPANAFLAELTNKQTERSKSIEEENDEDGSLSQRTDRYVQSFLVDFVYDPIFPSQIFPETCQLGLKHIRASEGPKKFPTWS